MLDERNLLCKILQFVPQADKLRANGCALVSKAFHESCRMSMAWHTVDFHRAQFHISQSQKFIARLGLSLRHIEDICHQSCVQDLLRVCSNITSVSTHEPIVLQDMVAIFPKLQKLHLKFPARKDVDPLSGLAHLFPLLTQLRDLSVGDVSSTTDLSPLLYCTHLEKLHVGFYGDAIPAFLAQHHASFPHLKSISLNLSGSTPADTQLDDLMQFVEVYGRRLEEFCLNGLRSDVVGRLADRMKNTFTPGLLHTLHLYFPERSEVPWNELQPLFEAVGVGLRDLRFNQCKKLTLEQFKAFMGACPVLQALQILDTRFTGAFVDVITEGACMPHLVWLFINLDIRHRSDDVYDAFFSLGDALLAVQPRRIAFAHLDKGYESVIVFRSESHSEFKWVD